MNKSSLRVVEIPRFSGEMGLQAFLKIHEKHHHISQTHVSSTSFAVTSFGSDGISYLRVQISKFSEVKKSPPHGILYPFLAVCRPPLSSI
ncbi:MAG: hypothetical protein M0O96_11400 [Desulforhopalus sp.]|nr:hypothetical protein [Desulforhopalus sp.]